MTKCRACGFDSGCHLFTGPLIGFDVKYYECDRCKYVFTEDPYWLDAAYSEAINVSDTGVMSRNLANSRIVLATLYVLNKLNGKVVDCAGGYGILVRLLRDLGVDSLWSDSYSPNLLARGFEHKNEKAELVTAFEAFEHFVHPSQELDRLLEIAPNVLVSTQLIQKPTPPHDSWWYYGKEHGQHIGFFRVETLEELAKRRGKTLLSDGHSYHLFTDKNVNSHAWRLLIRVNRFVTFLLKRHLRSRTWDDHVRMSASKKDS